MAVKKRVIREAIDGPVFDEKSGEFTFKVFRVLESEDATNP